MVEVSRWGGRHGSDVALVDTGWVELSVVGTSGAEVVSVRDTGPTVVFVVTGGPVDVVDSGS